MPGQTKIAQIDDQITALPQRAPVTLRVARAVKVIGMTEKDAVAAIESINSPLFIFNFLFGLKFI